MWLTHQKSSETMDTTTPGLVSSCSVRRRQKAAIIVKAKEVKGKKKRARDDERYIKFAVFDEDMSAIKKIMKIRQCLKF